MALSTKSLILYGLEVTDFNRSLDFKAASLGPTLMATLRLGFYSLTSLCEEIARAMNAADPVNTYSCTADRTTNGGTENRVTISTSGSFLSLLFASGPRVASTVAPLAGFAIMDRTGFTSYTGPSSAGIPIVPAFVGYNFVDQDQQPKVFGNVNVSASGLKEAIVFQIQRFIDVEFKYEQKARTKGQWKAFVDWAIQQRSFDFTPEIAFPSDVFEVTLDSSPGDGKGLGWAWKELIPDFPNQYTTGHLRFRLTPQ